VEDKTKQAEPMEFDFGDGGGPVPARKHPNGGGWVANTALADDSVYVGPGAMVYQNATLHDRVVVFGESRVYGDATLEDSVTLYQGVRVFGNAELCGNVALYEGTEVDRPPVIVTELFGWPALFISSPKQLVAVGCEVHSPAYWRAHARSIAHDHEVTGSVPKLLALLDMVYGKPRKRVGKKKK
jgi:carbonic anhydrase/acetyltransferase-like protein (isoleucine patch superfamily)